MERKFYIKSNTEKDMHCYNFRNDSQNYRNDCEKSKYETVKEWVKNNSEQLNSYN